MPTYEYNCKRCGETIEVFQSFSEKPLRKHPDCGGDLQKVFHARGVVFKGSGFYSTDSRASDSKSSKKTEPAKKTDSAKKSETSTTPTTAGTSSTD
ncbi:MAG: FmdB family zinc ribbon protein [Acidimicrobiia bacterium]